MCAHTEANLSKRRFWSLFKMSRQSNTTSIVIGWPKVRVRRDWSYIHCHPQRRRWWFRLYSRRGTAQMIQTVHWQGVQNNSCTTWPILSGGKRRTLNMFPLRRTEGGHFRTDNSQIPYIILPYTKETPPIVHGDRRNVLFWAGLEAMIRLWVFEDDRMHCYQAAKLRSG